VPKELDRTWQLLDDFAEVARLLGSHTADPDLAETVCDLALRMVGGDHASITSIRSGQFTTVLATSDIPEHADKIQSKAGSGPCVDVIHANVTTRVDDLATDPRWPTFGSAASAELGMHSMLAQVLPVDNDVLGALNVYSAKTNAFDTADEKIIAVLGSAAVTAMRAARHQEKLTTWNGGCTPVAESASRSASLSPREEWTSTRLGRCCPRQVRTPTPRSPNWPTG
jgi:transcriptional regulator with GAF, ATPase, and Fis domain